MAGDWIKFECATPDKPEVWAIAAVLEIDPDAVVGKLLRVWGWFDQQTEDGNANKASKNMLDRLVGCIGFCDAVCGVGWMVIGDDSISLPDFDKHNGKTAKNRINTAKRVAAYKGRQKSNAEGNGKVTEKFAELTDRQAIPRPIRALIFQRDKSTCVYCGRVDGEYCPPETKRDAIMSVDHVIPISRQGSENIDNLVCACMSCNNFKNDRTPEEAGLKWPVDEDGKRYGSVTSPLPKEEKRREELKDIVPSEREAVPVQEIVNLFNKSFETLPEVKILSEKRRATVRKRWLENKNMQSIERWQDFFSYIKKSEFLMGRSDKPFSLTFDWMFNPTNFIKIYEGNYHK